MSRICEICGRVEEDEAEAGDQLAVRPVMQMLSVCEHCRHERHPHDDGSQ